MKKNISKREAATTSMDIALSVIGGKWKLLILYALLEKPLRTNELQKRLPLISERVLIRQLRNLEKNLLVERAIFPFVPPKVEYSVTEYGKTLKPIVQELSAWGYNHLKKKFPKKGIAFKVKPFVYE